MSPILVALITAAIRILISVIQKNRSAIAEVTAGGDSGVLDQIEVAMMAAVVELEADTEPAAINWAALLSMLQKIGPLLDKFGPLLEQLGPKVKIVVDLLRTIISLNATPQPPTVV